MYSLHHLIDKGKSTEPEISGADLERIHHSLCAWKVLSHVLCRHSIQSNVLLRITRMNECTPNLDWIEIPMWKAKSLRRGPWWNDAWSKGLWQAVQRGQFRLEHSNRRYCIASWTDGAFPFKGYSRNVQRRMLGTTVSKSQYILSNSNPFMQAIFQSTRFRSF